MVGLMLLPIAVAGNLVPEPKGIGLKTSLGLSAVGVLTFFIGWLIQQGGRGR
jgi:hypothetical protein